MMDPSYDGPKMEARGTLGDAVRAPRGPDPRLAEDPFFYGYRWVRVKTAAGKTVSEQVPLTREDLLDPQEDDRVSNGSWHNLITGRLGEILRTLFAFRGRDDVLVTANVKMLWKDPGVHRVARTSPSSPASGIPTGTFRTSTRPRRGRVRCSFSRCCRRRRRAPTMGTSRPSTTAPASRSTSSSTR